MCVWVCVYVTCLVTSTKTFLTDISKLCGVFFQSECKPFRSRKANVPSDYQQNICTVFCALWSQLRPWVFMEMIAVRSLYCGRWSDSSWETLLQWALVWIRWSDCGIQRKPSSSSHSYSSCCSSSVGELQEVRTRTTDVCAQCCRLVRF